MKKMILKIEDLEERIAPGLVVDLLGTSAPAASSGVALPATADVGNENIPGAGDAHDNAHLAPALSAFAEA